MMKKKFINNNVLLFIGTISFVLFILYFEMQVLHLEGNNDKLSKYLTFWDQYFIEDVVIQTSREAADFIMVDNQVWNGF